MVPFIASFDNAHRGNESITNNGRREAARTVTQPRLVPVFPLVSLHTDSKIRIVLRMTSYYEHQNAERATGRCACTRPAPPAAGVPSLRSADRTLQRPLLAAPVRHDSTYTPPPTRTTSKCRAMSSLSPLGLIILIRPPIDTKFDTTSPYEPRPILRVRIEVNVRRVAFCE